MADYFYFDITVKGSETNLNKLVKKCFSIRNNTYFDIDNFIKYKRIAKFRYPYYFLTINPEAPTASILRFLTFLYGISNLKVFSISTFPFLSNGTLKVYLTFS